MSAAVPSNQRFPTLEAMSRLPRWATLLIATASIGVLAACDFASGREISFSIFYLAPVLYVTWCTDSQWGAATALLAAVTWGLVDFAADATYSSAWIPVWNAGVRLGFFLASAYLLASARQANQRLAQLAHTDSLTDLANTRSFYRELEHEILRQRRHGSPFAMAYIDLDRFKEINDTHGHATGDDLLRSVAAGIAGAVRLTDTVARLGGDEFGVLLPETGEQAAVVAASRIQAAVAGAMRSVAGEIIEAGATVGTVVFVAPPASPDSAVQLADELMYQGKRFGRGSVQLKVFGGPDPTIPAPDVHAGPESQPHTDELRAR